MTVTTSWQGRILVASLRGELDMRNHEKLATTLEELAQSDATGLVLNFAEVIYLASIGIGMLLKLVKQAREKGMGVRLAAPRPAVKMVLEMVKADSVLPMDATVEASVEKAATAVAA
jgi:anti-sigma B factor antagonist